MPSLPSLLLRQVVGHSRDWPRKVQRPSILPHDLSDHLPACNPLPQACDVLVGRLTTLLTSQQDLVGPMSSFAPRPGNPCLPPCWKGLYQGRSQVPHHDLGSNSMRLNDSPGAVSSKLRSFVGVIGQKLTKHPGARRCPKQRPRKSSSSPREVVLISSVST